MDWDGKRLAEWYGGKEGRVLARTLAAALKRLPGAVWVGSLRPSVLGVGYVEPFTAVWPGAHVEEADWDDARSECRYDRILIVHALEGEPRPDELLERCWKALRPDGVLIVLVPNWLGWHRWGDGPLAAGRSYTRARLGQALRAAGFKDGAKASAGGMLLAAARKEVLGAKALRRDARSGKVGAVPVGVATPACAGAGSPLRRNRS